MMLVLLAAIDEGLALIGKPGEAPDVGSRLKERQRPTEQLLHWQEW
jgi:hypothetical protein